MQNYIAHGGIPGRFRIRLPEYFPRVSRSSMFSGLLTSNKLSCFGKYSVTRLPFGVVAALSELTLAQAMTKGRMRVSLVYDGEGYTKSEASTLTDLTTQAMLEA